MSSLDENIKDSDMKLMAIRVLNILKHFYTFKELENILGLSYQRLWKYISLHTVPELKTAQYIIRVVKEKQLLEHIMDKMLGDRENINDWKLVENTGFIELVTTMIANTLKNYRISTVISADDQFSYTMAAVLAVRLRSKLCLISDKYIEDDITAVLVKCSSGLKVLALPRECGDKKKSAVFIKFRADSLDDVRSYINLIRKLGYIKLIPVIVLFSGDESELEGTEFRVVIRLAKRNSKSQ